MPTFWDEPWERDRRVREERERREAARRVAPAPRPARRWSALPLSDRLALLVCGGVVVIALALLLLPR